ncbi:MAG: NUDIX domain-containing protein, partial [Planctomycetota bacterium]
MAKKTTRSVSGVTRPSAAKPIRRAWQYCPKCGQAAAKQGKNPFRCQVCGYTHFFGPVSAVGAITTDAAGQVLLLVRAKDPGKGKYGLPGGFIDAGETAEEALHREVKEVQSGLDTTDADPTGNMLVRRTVIARELGPTRKLAAGAGLCVMCAE